MRQQYDKAVDYELLGLRFPAEDQVTPMSKRLVLELNTQEDALVVWRRCGPWLVRIPCISAVSKYSSLLGRGRDLILRGGG